MKKTVSFFLFIIMLACIWTLPALAASFQLTYYEEAIYAGGVMDLYVFAENGVEPYTYQWQYDVGIGDGHWYDLVDNDDYSGTKTNHLQLRTKPGEYPSWDEIPFSCVVTDAEGDVCYTPDLHMVIYPTDELILNMNNWGYGLHTPKITNVANFKTSDTIYYSANAFSGSKIGISCESKSVDDIEILRNSEVELTRQIQITENGHTTTVSDQTTYIPYTIGKNAVTVDIKLLLSIGEHDLGELDSKTIQITTSKPTVVSTVKTNTDCSLLRYTYNESQKLASIPKGTYVEVLGKEGSYYQVFYNNYVGYIGTSLLNVPQPSYDPVIKNVDVIIPAPVAGEKPSFTCDFLTEGCELYHTDPILWTNRETGKAVLPTETFQEGQSYSLSIWLSAQSGYKFQIDASIKPKLTGSINGNLPPFINKAYEQDPEEVIELIYTFHNVQKAPQNPHVCAPVLKDRVEPTCTENGHEAYFYCTCGMNYKDTAGQEAVDISQWGVIPATGHTPSSWRITQVYHYKACTSCGEFLTQEDHYGGVATCAEKGKCSVCGDAYLPENENHDPEDKWTACGNLYHAHLCIRCGAHCDPEDHTDTTKCLVCGYMNVFFSDVKSTDYFYDAVVWAVNNGVTQGTSDTTFSPEESCTRGQVVTFLWRAAGCPEPKMGSSPFTDVDQTAYYHDAVVWAVEQGITNGTSDTTFSPEESCTRGQVVTFLWRSQGLPAATTLNPFVDVPSDAYYYDAVLWAVKEEITKGTSDTTFSPEEKCTRGQVVTFLYRCNQKP